MRVIPEFSRIAPDVKLGEGVQIYAFVNLYGCDIGDATRIGAFVEIQKNATVGRRCKISSHTFICEGVTIEDECFLGHHVVFINDKYPAAVNAAGELQTEADWQLIRTRVCRGATIGSGAVILGGITIGEGALVGAGSVVTKDVPPRTIVAGNPARKLRELRLAEARQRPLPDGHGAEGFVDVAEITEPRASANGVAEPRAPVSGREVEAVFGKKEVTPDPDWEWEFAGSLRKERSAEELMALFSRFAATDGSFDRLMRRVLLRALSRCAGHGLRVGPGVVLHHPETMEFGDDVSIASHATIQGRFDGTCKIGNKVWIGPNSYFDARNLVIEDYAGIGPGVKVLGSAHTGEPLDVPIITTNLLIRPVVIGFGADVGTGSVILPGIRLGAHSMIGAGAVVTHDVPDYAVVAGVPARILRSRKEARITTHNGEQAATEPRPLGSGISVDRAEH
jgi:acetyltransferase-like isoleucine patch superfamily enzyme